MERRRTKQDNPRWTGLAGRGLRRLLLACIALACQGAAFSEDGSISEETLKVALVYKLTKFIEWPVAVTSQAATFDICADTGSPMAEPLMALADRQTLGRPIRVRLLDPVDEDDHRCDVLYLSDEVVEAAQRQRTAERHTLLIGDRAGFAIGGGDIEIRRAGRRFRFVVNLASAEGKQLKISAPLLQLSEIVGSEAP